MLNLFTSYWLDLFVHGFEINIFVDYFWLVDDQAFLNLWDILWDLFGFTIDKLQTFVSDNNFFLNMCVMGNRNYFLDELLESNIDLSNNVV